MNTTAMTSTMHAKHLLTSRLFTKFPDYLKFFNQFPDLDLESMHENRRLIKHAVKVIDTITFVVESIGEQAKTDQLNDALLNLVRSHLKKRVGLKEFRNLGIVLIDFICELNNRRDRDGTTKLPTTNLRNSSRLIGRNNDISARGGSSSASSSQDSETMTSALDKIRASSSPSSSSEDENLVARTASSILIENNDEIVASQIDNLENHHKFPNATPPSPETKIDDNDNELGARRSQAINLDANFLVSAWTKLYGTILDLVKDEESQAHDNK